MFSGHLNLAGFVLRSIALTGALSHEGANSWRCPLKTTPTSRPHARTDSVKGDRPKTNSSVQKKDHENKANIHSEQTS